MKKVLKSMLAIALAAFAFTSCEDVPMPYDQPGSGSGEGSEVIEPAGSGTADDPYNVAAALEYVNGMEADTESSTDIYIKGKVVSINTNYDESGTYGNAIFYISDDGTNKNQFYVYRALYLGNKKYASGDVLAEGDDVIICGKVVNYKGTTPETVQSKAFLYSLNGQNAGGGGGSSTTTEVTCAKAVELTNALDDNATSSETYTVTGYITEVVGSVSKNQQTFWMADTKDGGRVFEAYWANLPEGVSEFKAGAKVKITGNLTKYVKDGKVTAEIKNANVEIVEQGGGNSDTPSGSEISCAKAVELTNALADNATSSETYTVTGYITEVVGSVSKNQQTFWMADTKDGGRVFEAYWANLPEGVSEFKAGTKVKITGKLQKYVKDGNVTPEIKNANVEIVEEGGGSETPAGNVTKTVDGATVTLVVNEVTEGDKTTVDLSAQGWESGKAVDPATITLNDGTKITFAKGEGSNTPAYYDATKGVRVYAKNTITISGKAVAKVVLTCDVYNGTAYTGNSTLYGSASGTTFTICNEHSEAKGGDQLRVQTIEITYAK